MCALPVALSYIEKSNLTSSQTFGDIFVEYQITEFVTSIRLGSDHGSIPRSREDGRERFDRYSFEGWRTFEKKIGTCKVNKKQKVRSTVTPLGSQDIDLLAVRDVTSCLSLTQPGSRPQDSTLLAHKDVILSYLCEACTHYRHCSSITFIAELLHPRTYGTFPIRVAQSAGITPRFITPRELYANDALPAKLTSRETFAVVEKE
ncbi:hypothetical protein K0M31_018042 [Melipona bicolor]|uniref:Uncharacterized protein n=1 Tax=Melipona bicolor TaxID=60889 RepID=A0AA40FE73_9HYME|nr:hypothetical protein K0M31_018042 [Melipona bicolor]